ncbi:MAG: hypothetical protein ACJ790_13105 [Myxococcaceae bacterium]
MRVEVEQALDAGGRAIVLVRALEIIAFRPEGLELHGCRVKSFDLPRAMDKDGNPRMDLLGFVLERPQDLARFSPGQRVELKNR